MGRLESSICPFGIRSKRRLEFLCLLQLILLTTSALAYICSRSPQAINPPTFFPLGKRRENNQVIKLSKRTINGKI
ncbi:hypothetical protein EUGRSUZ_A02659 [Eucalyptus grandis]|uniref:Uncharacterized protein n=2 Tax=Eucalyptus grandis TaxID=71139 RepID=A0ACC3M7X0_EUCGR|nr:hypothetical protein EUGRSUZ_A02659 [Eucalyptus grandis]